MTVGVQGSPTVPKKLGIFSLELPRQIAFIDSQHLPRHPIDRLAAFGKRQGFRPDARVTKATGVQVMNNVLDGFGFADQEEFYRLATDGMI